MAEVKAETTYQVGGVRALLQLLTVRDERKALAIWGDTRKREEREKSTSSHGERE
jgi:hypothetical protein